MVTLFPYLVGVGDIGNYVEMRAERDDGGDRIRDDL